MSSDYPDRSSKGVFFIIPCVDVYEKIDMRTATYEIPPQEVGVDHFAADDADDDDDRGGL